MVLSSTTTISFWVNRPQKKISEEQLNGVKVTAFIAFSNKHGLLGPYWFEERGKTVTVNSPRYCFIMQRFHDYLSQKLTPGQLRLTWFMQDGATPHTGNASVEFLQGLFGNCLISLRTEHEWVLHNPGLNPLNFWFWGASKGVVYAKKPCTLVQLKQNVKTYAAEVTNDIWKKVGKNFCLCLKAFFNRNGSHIKNVDYKKFVYAQNNLPIYILFTPKIEVCIFHRF